MNIQFISKRIMILMLAVLATLVSCNEIPPASISVIDPTTEQAVGMIHANPMGEEVFLKVLSGEWSAVSDEDWCVVQKDKGYKYGEVTSLYIRKGGAEDRTATVTYTSGDAKFYIVVKQNKLPDVVEILPGQSSIDYKAQKLRISLNANVAWTATSTNDWAKIGDVKENYFEITFDENASTLSREAVITVTSNSSVKAETFIITQFGREASITDLSPSSFTYEAKAGSQKVQITTNVYNPKYSVNLGGEDWWKIIWVSDNEFSVELEENTSTLDREVAITVIAESEDGTEVVYKQLFVKQQGLNSPEIVVGRNNLVVENKSADHSVSLSANGEITLAADVAWLKDLSFDSETGKVTFTTEENKTLKARTGIITMTAVIGSEFVKETITVYQNGISNVDLQVSPTNISVLEHATTKEITAISDANSENVKIEWLPSTAGWVGISASATGSKSTATVSIEANAGLYDRTTDLIVKLTSGDVVVVKSVVITQKAKTL